MQGCLLCLDINKEFVDCIKVASKQWQELNIKNLIDKHLWMMDNVHPSSWLCCNCWQSLYDFHKFYMRIEEAHMDFGRLMKEECLNNNLTKIETESHEVNDEFYNEINLNEPCIEPEIYMDQLLIEDDKTIIKIEPDENNLERCKRPSKENISGSQMVKEDPLNSTKTSSKRQTRKITLDKSKPKPENLEIKQDSEKIKLLLSSPTPRGSSDSDSINSYKDIDYKPDEEIKRHKKSTKKIRHHKKKSVDSDDSDTDVDDDDLKDDLQTKRAKQTTKQKDQFINENFKITCVLCQVSMANFKSLVKHFQIAHKERAYAVCCNRKFYERRKLLEHVHWHLEPSNYKCNQCGKELSSKITLKIHQLLHVAEEGKTFSCTECGKTYPQEYKLNAHIDRIHLKKYMKICDICGKHLRCGEAFQRHILEHEGKSLPSLRCEICGLVVTTRHGLRRHKAMQHPVDGKKEHICNICFKVSPNIYALRKHINCTHKAENLHKCTMCGRAFKRPLALREHMATHTGIALYTCPWCPKTFNANGGMHAHRKSQHPIEWEESRRQKNIEKYITTADVTEIDNINKTNLKVDLA